MGEKNRLYEIFSKVNKVKINEQEFEGEELKNELVEEAGNEIRLHFRRNPKMFEGGIPYDLRINVVNEEINLKLLENENGIALVKTNDEQLEYNVFYNTTIKGLPFKIKIPLVVEIERKSQGDKIDLVTKTWVIPNEIEITYNNF